MAQSEIGAILMMLHFTQLAKEVTAILCCDLDPYLSEHGSPGLFVGHVVQRLLLKQIGHVLVPEVEAGR